MTDSFTPPKSSVASFGVTVLGRPFNWTHVVDGELTTSEFHAKASYSFDSQLDYNAITAELRTASLAQSRRTVKTIQESTAEGVTDEDMVRMLQESADQSVQEEKENWQKVVDQTCLLVADADVPTLRPLLIEGDPTEVRALRAWLEEVVLKRVVKEVEAVANVDPTLPPPPSTSPDGQPSGPDSTSEEPPSTG